MSLNDIASSLTSGVLQPYKLDVRRAGVLAKELSVVSFEGTEELGQPSRFVIRLTHPLPDLPRASFLGVPTVFSISPPALPGLPALGAGRKIQGVITGFNQIDSSKDVTTYQVILESRLAPLRNVTRCRLFLDQTFPQIIESILREHGFAGDSSNFSFTLLRQYEKRPIVTQWHESDLAFVQRLCRRSGIWFRIDAGEWGEVVHFGDDFTHYRRQPALAAPMRAHAGLESVGAEAVQALETHTTSIPQSIIVGDYNRLAAPATVETEINLARNDKTTYGQSYSWGTLHLDAGQAEWEARLRHEAALSAQIVYRGKSNVLGLVPGAVFRMTNKVLPDAEYGQLITKVTHHGARDTAYHNTYAAIPSDRIYRLPLNEADWPKIAGTVSARIASPDRYPHAYMNEDGDYMVQFDFDRDPRTAGLNSCWMRLAKPFAGSLQTGFHFPLLDGTEVAVGFHDGDPDRPFIAHAMHDSHYSDLITNQKRWMSRNEIRTQSNNKLRLEDWEGEEHIKLATEYGKSQLNLGHLVDDQRKKRGEGVEIRTDAWGSVRAGKGLFLSADAQPKANGQQLDMSEAKAQLDEALTLMQSLSEATRAAQAHAAEIDKQTQLLETRLDQLQQAVLLASAPAGMALTSGHHLQLAARGNLIASARGNADIGVLKKFTVAAGDAISLFAQRLGIKVFAAKGKVEIEAQSDEMALNSLKDLKLTSVDGKIILSSTKEVWIGAGGSYIKITPEGIENGTPGDILEKCAHWDKPDPAFQSLEMNQWKGTAFNEGYLAEFHNGKVAKNHFYELIRADGGIIKGVTDANGMIPKQQGLDVESFTVQVLGPANKGNA